MRTTSICLLLGLCGLTHAFGLTPPATRSLTARHRVGSSKSAPVALLGRQSAQAVALPATTLQAVATTGGADEKPSTAKVGSYFALWYALNIGYNVYNKKALNVVALPWTIASLQLYLGIPYVLLMWASGLRKAPKLTNDNVKNLMPVSLCHLFTHIGAVVSLGAGAVSFTHIVKASEPVVSAGLSAAFLGQVFHPVVYLTLVPIIGGVGLASLKELSFTWLAFGAAMVSNVASASRGIVGKGLMGKPQGENMTPTNLYAVLTMISAVLITPLALVAESPAKIASTVSAAISSGAVTGPTLALHVVLSGLFYYMYNEVAFLALDSVNPVTHAVGNTIKRVVIILASVVVFRNPISPLGQVGSAIAIFGTLLYSLAKGKFA